MTSPGGTATPSHRRDAVVAFVLVTALAAVSTWAVKIAGPRAVNPDYFCNCSVLEGLIAAAALPMLIVACVVVGLRLRRARGASRVAGIVAGLAALALPLTALLLIMYFPFPTIEQLQGWSSIAADSSTLVT